MTDPDTRTLSGRRLPFGFEMTHTADQVAEALRGHFPAGELRELAARVDKLVDRRRRRRKHTGRLPALARLLELAAQPTVGPPQPFRVYDNTGQPVEVVLTSGPNAGERVAVVPPNTMFEVPESAGGPVTVLPAYAGKAAADQPADAPC